VWVPANHPRLGEILKPDDENRAPRRHRSRRHLTGKRPPTSQDPQGRRCFALHVHRAQPASTKDCLVRQIRLSGLNFLTNRVFFLALTIS